jgi:hypothetical protein
MRNADRNIVARRKIVEDEFPVRVGLRFTANLTVIAKQLDRRAGDGMCLVALHASTQISDLLFSRKLFKIFEVAT